MIERKFVAEKIKEFQIQEYINETLGDVGHSHTKMQKTALGERIIIYSSRPGLVVGRKGENIKRLTREMKKKFKLENPQIEISEIQNMYRDAQLVADRIASTLERFGSKRFKGTGHQMMSAVMDSGALGVEILISGKVPSARARTWRFYKGYLKKCGDVAVSDVLVAYGRAKTKLGIIGIKVSIMPSDIQLPDSVTMLETPLEQLQNITLEEPEKKKTKKKRKRTTKKKPARKEAPKEEPKIEVIEEKVEAPAEKPAEAPKAAPEVPAAPKAPTETPAEAVKETPAKEEGQ